MTNKMERTVKTYENWEGNLDDYLQIGDLVDEEMYEYFLNVLPPAYDTSYILQVGEACDHIDGKATYDTLVCTLDGWEYRGECFRGQTREPHLN